MQIITFASTKGGVGKSSLAAIATDGFLRKGETVRIIDLDSQGSLRNWAVPVSERHPELMLSKVELDDNATFAHYYNAMLEIIEDETDWVLIDTKGTDDFRLLPALALSDLVICPSGPVEEEVKGVQKIVGYLETALKEIESDTEPMDMLRVIYQRPNGFHNTKMAETRNLIFNHFGAVYEMHYSGAIKTFIDCKLTTTEAIADAIEQKKSPKSIENIQKSADGLTTSLKGQFDE